MWFLRVLGIFLIVCMLVVLGPMIFPLLIVGVLVLLAYGIGEASRWGWR
jgi:uncharacterized RDD family membrane protein YckC